MGDCMIFPETFDEFAEQYKIVDSKEIYTNGTELIPIFRVRQWLMRDYPVKNKADVIEIDKVAEILADVTGASPCDFIGNEWLVSCCEYVGHCCQKSDGECWMQYLKYFGNEKEQCNENTR